MRQQHRTAVLTEILLAGTTTRADLMRIVGLSSASITNIVGDLIAEGVVAEVGSRSSSGGRPVAVLGPHPQGAYALGADVGERGVAVELFDLSMRVIDREEVEGDHTEPVSRIIDDISIAVAALRERHHDIWPRLTGLGLALPGPVEVNADGSQTLHAQSLGWPAVPVGHFAAMNLPVFADNGAKAQARAEMWFGAARGAEHAVVALFGRGVGMGTIIDGALHRGAHSSAGEWGHVSIRPGGRECRCGNLGCIEAYAGADAILEEWERRGGPPQQSSGWDSMVALLDAAATGDNEAAGVVNDVVDVIGAGLGGLINLLNPERVVVGGWVGMLLMDRCQQALRSAMDAYSLTRPASQATLVPSHFRGDAIALGAAILAFEPLLDGSYRSRRHHVAG
ncbi:MAG: ROK-family transcriptional regulator [Actinobacteria bacterium HGW-Actinobacteria-4]|nr:MAG: ROK-family transcriptional regulator [Actinobacteria bacterium HGW-Actinobacteria-4]